MLSIAHRERAFRCKRLETRRVNYKLKARYAHNAALSLDGESPAMRKALSKWQNMLTNIEEMYSEPPLPAPTKQVYRVKRAEFTVPISVPDDETFKTPFEDEYLASLITPDPGDRKVEVYESMKYNVRIPSFPIYETEYVPEETRHKVKEGEVFSPQFSEPSTIRSWADIDDFIKQNLGSQLQLRDAQPNVNEDAIQKLGIPDDYYDYLRSYRKKIPKIRRREYVHFPEPAHPGKVFFNADLTSIEIWWLENLTNRAKEAQEKISQDKTQEVTDKTDFISTIAKKENLDPTLHNQNTQDSVRDVAMFSSTYFTMPDASEGSLYNLLKFAGPLPKQKQRLKAYMLAEALYAANLTNRAMGRSVYRTMTDEEIREQREAPMWFDHILTTGLPGVSKTFDHKRLGLVLQTLAGDREREGAMRWFATYVARGSESPIRPEKIRLTTPADISSSSSGDSPSISSSVSSPTSSHSSRSRKHPPPAHVIEEIKAEIPQVIDWDHVEMTELRKVSEAKVKPETSNLNMGLIIRGIPKGTTVEEFFYALRPLVFQNMKFLPSPTQNFYEIQLENVPAATALAFNIKLRDAFFGDARLSLIPVFPSDVDPQVAANFSKELGIPYDPVAQKALNEKLEWRKKLEKLPRELGFFVRAPDNYVPYYDDLVISDQEFAQRKALLTQDWENAQPSTTSSSSGGRWVFVGGDAYWHLSWPRKYPGDSWRDRAAGDALFTPESQNNDNYHVMLEPNWTYTGGQVPDQPTALSVAQRIAFMNKHGTLVNLFGGPEVKVFRDAAFIDKNAFTIGIQHPPLELYYLKPGNPKNLNRGGLRTIPLPKNFADYQSYEQFLEKNFAETSSFPMERQRWGRCIQRAISDYFGISMERVLLLIKPEGNDDELVNTRSLIFVRIRDREGENRVVADHYEKGVSQHYPYKSVTMEQYDDYDERHYKQLDSEPILDDNEISRILSKTDETNEVARKHAQNLVKLSNTPPAYNKTVLNKKTGAVKKSLVINPYAFAYHGNAEPHHMITPQDIETWKMGLDRLSELTQQQKTQTN